MSTRLRKLALHAVGCLIVVAAGLAATPSPAAAASGLVVCTGTQTTTYSPGLTSTAQPVTRAGQNIFSPCLSTVAPFSLSGSTSFAYTTTLSCLSLTAASTGTNVISWSTGATSTFDFNLTVTTVQGQTVVTLTGAITAGLYNGATALEVITSVGLDLTACLTPGGLTSTYGVSQLTITLP